MEPPREFMQRYLKDRAEWQDTSYRRSNVFHEKYFGEPYLAYYRHFHMGMKTDPEQLISVEEDRLSATAITSALLGESQQRYRYHLSFASGAWLIQRKEWECFACQGTGRGARPSCNVCHGKGWHDPKSKTA